MLGQFASSSAMAAVGATSSLNSLMVNLFLGLSIGCSVVMAHSYGAQDWRRVHDTVHTAILLAVFCGAVLVVVGVPLLPIHSEIARGHPRRPAPSIHPLYADRLCGHARHDDL